MASLTRLARAWQAMERERRFAVAASVALFVSMFLPWYQQNAVVSAPRTVPLQSRNLNAFQVFSFVEAAVLLVAVALMYMLFARADGREFNMPGGDGTVVFAAGIWAGALLIFRLFDKPGISSHGVAGNVGVQWGIFFALAAAGLIAYSGSRMRAARGGGHLPRHSGPSSGREHRPAPEPREPPPDYGSEPPQAPAEEQPTQRIAAPAQGPAPARAGARGRPRFPPSPEQQLSFEDPPSGPQ
jgi:hypothetical protein